MPAFAVGGGKLILATGSYMLLCPHAPPDYVADNTYLNEALKQIDHLSNDDVEMKVRLYSRLSHAL